jgi:hypothetical protein
MVHQRHGEIPQPDIFGDGSALLVALGDEMARAVMDEVPL